MSLIFDEAESELIRIALEKEKFHWSSEELKPVRDKIKVFLKGKWSEQCCYCRSGLVDFHNIDIDIEHILPSSKYKRLAFNADNLNLSCKRCNMKIKGDNTDFLVDEDSVEEDFTNPDQYYLIHPNFDVYEDNLKYYNITFDSAKIIKYKPLTPKGTYTYGYFKLDKIERNTFNAVQGIEDPEHDSETVIPPSVMDALDKIGKDL